MRAKLEGSSSFKKKVFFVIFVIFVVRVWPAIFVVDNARAGAYIRRYILSFRRPDMLEATRTRISFSGEVLTAAAFLAATVLVGLLIVRELRVAPPALSAAAP